MKSGRRIGGWRRLLRSLCVALAGLAALLGLEYAALRFRPMTPVAAVAYFALYGLIVWGKIRGLAGPAPEARRAGTNCGETEPPALTVVDSTDTLPVTRREWRGLTAQGVSALRAGRG